MKIEVKTANDGTAEVMLSEVYSGVGIQTADGLFGIAERDGGIEVLLDGKTVWPPADDEPRRLEDEEEYKIAMELIETLVARDPPAGSAGAWHLRKLAAMVERYEKERYPIGESSEGIASTEPPPMTEEDAVRTAQNADRISRKVAPVIRGEEKLAVAVALTSLAAHSVLHDGAGEADFMEVCRMAWKKSQTVHSAGCKN